MGGGESLGIWGTLLVLWLIGSPFIVSGLLWKLVKLRRSENDAAISAKREGLQRAVVERENEGLNERVELLTPFRDLAQRRSEQCAALEAELKVAQGQLAILSQYQGVADLATAMSALTEQAHTKIREAQARARTAFAEEKQKLLTEREALDDLVRASRDAIALDGRDSKQLLRDTQAKCLKVLDAAHVEAAMIAKEARDNAEAFAGEALSIRDRARELELVANAMKAIILGYGDAYLVPTHSALDDLALEFGYDEAGQMLSVARARTRALIGEARAGTCDYVEPSRREAAVRFVVDAFNGKVDSILSRMKSSNEATLAQEIKDAFHLVNHSGAPFRNARVIEEYLHSRLDELKWSSRANILKERARDEQRLLREQIREEEKARRERERAIKEAELESAALAAAMARARAQVAAAGEAQRAEYELQLQELQERLAEAEARGQRAISMAQQTRAGHVYVISNIGSFGEDVFKIGMTRRIEPQDRVRELGDASVPFEFDVHGMIYSDDAPALERSLHVRCLAQQMNKVNARKEFFRVHLSDIQRHVQELGYQAFWTVTAAATSYRETRRLEERMRQDPALAKVWAERQIAIELSEDESAQDSEVLPRADTLTSARAD